MVSAIPAERRDKPLGKVPDDYRPRHASQLAAEFQPYFIGGVSPEVILNGIWEKEGCGHQGWGTEPHDQCWQIRQCEYS